MLPLIRPNSNAVANMIPIEAANTVVARARGASRINIANASGHTTYHCSSTASDQRWRKTGGSIGAKYGVQPTI